MRERIARPDYLQRLIEYKDKDIVKVVTGIRRCGKSTLLALFEDYLLDSGTPKERILHMNMESLKHRQHTDYVSFYEHVASKIVVGQMNYLIFDELQAIAHWERAIESFRLDFDVDIYITGSNAYMLSSEFSTLLSGRYVEIRMLPLSFKEFLLFYEFAPDVSIDDKFQKYLQFGGMPALRQFQLNEARSFETLEGIFNTVIIRDVLERNRAADYALLNKLVHFLCGNIGSVTSPNSIGNVLADEGDIQTASKKAGKGIAGKTVGKYIRMLKSAYVFYSVGRYDIKGKQCLRTLEKNYIVDIGLRNMLLGYRGADRGHILENIVYLELLRRGWRVYVGKAGDAEVDFVAEKPHGKLYVQVAETMLAENVRERELRPLMAIRDNYEKVVLSMDKSYLSSYDGIKSISIIDFLLSESY